MLQTLGTAASVAAASAWPAPLLAQGPVARVRGTALRLGLNAYSFNEPLRAGTMTLDGLIDYCAEQGFEGLDATGYYFPGYPVVPDDKFLYALKRRAFVNGVTIAGTGVRNDFAVADAAARARDVEMVKRWIEAAAKLGATVVRIFAGLKVPDGGTFDRTLEWMVPDIQACVAHGREHGVIVGLQNHNDFLKTADETIRVVKAVNSPYVKLLYDIYHMQIMEGDIIATIQAKHTYFSHYHTGGVPGRAEIDETQELHYPAIMKAIVATGYTGWVAQEFIPKRDDKIASLKQAVGICTV